MRASGSQRPPEARLGGWCRTGLWEVRDPRTAGHAGGPIRWRPLRDAAPDGDRDPGVARRGHSPVAASLLAGAGVMGIVLGVAAGPLVGNLIAGIQIAFTQPIRVDDVVVIEGEWGRIEEVTAAYVVVAIWDKRRLIVPLSRIVSSPVENWTRVSSEILGTVSIFTDYRTPVDEIRDEFKRVLDESGMWDGEAWGVQVTDATESTMKVRALMSAPDAGTAWNLRCLVRERLIGFLQEKHPEALPTAREIEFRVPLGDGAG